LLAEALATLPKSSHPNLLVGFNKADDAGVYRLTDEIALVQTVDFFPPIVDDPYDFGQIAAANALSDVYAMGGKPLTALNIVGFPDGKMPTSVLTELLRGGTDKIAESGAIVVGGHSIKDAELKYGVSVTGLVHPDRVISNAGAKPGDKIYLTKPLGTGLITTGIKRKAVGPELERIVSAQMAQLNDKAAEQMVRFRTHAATDVTGFGLLGHALEMALGSEVSLRFLANAVPTMPQACELARADMIPGGAKANRAHLEGRVKIADSVPEDLVAVFYDPQTSGGLLIALDPDDAEPFEKAMSDNKRAAWLIGDVTHAGDFPLYVE